MWSAVQKSVVLVQTHSWIPFAEKSQPIHQLHHHHKSPVKSVKTTPTYGATLHNNVYINWMQTLCLCSRFNFVTMETSGHLEEGKSKIATIFCNSRKALNPPVHDLRRRWWQPRHWRRWRTWSKLIAKHRRKHMRVRRRTSERQRKTSSLHVLHDGT